MGFDVLNAQYDFLRYEQHSLAVVLCAITHLISFLPNEIQLLVEWRSSNSNHPLTYYILTTILLIFDPINPTSSIPSVWQTLATVYTTICGHAHFRAIPTLLSLIPLGILLKLKGAIFDVLAAFCEPGAGAAGIEICKAVWMLMERLEVINVCMWPSTRVSMATGKGMEVELEQKEFAHNSYPATIPFLKLLSTLIHTPKQISLQDQVAGTEPLNMIPESLGQPYNLPGIGPYISFYVFAKIPNCEYIQPSDQWETNGLCLCFTERSFNLESLWPR